jgi:prepilin-type N-terminal cleavage/methylation domain-containing protein
MWAKVAIVCKPYLFGEIMKLKSRVRQAGFTLVEIAIVLVIIGLLLGGVLKGQELIKNTKVKSIYNQYRELAAATYGYQDRYKAVPGDDPQALTRGWTAGATAIVNGDGQGWIDAGQMCAAGSAAQACQALYHLRLAGFITGTDTTAPTHAFGGRVALSRTDSFVGGFSKPVGVCFEWLNNETTRALEALYDDGSATTGAIRGSGNYMAGAVDANGAQFTCWVI